MSYLFFVFIYKTSLIVPSEMIFTSISLYECSFLVRQVGW